jgi:hypothetical protein
MERAEEGVGNLEGARKVNMQDLRAHYAATNGLYEGDAFDAGKWKNKDLPWS